MSLITAYFKKETVSVDATLPELPSSAVDASEIKCTDPEHHSTNPLLDEDSNVACPSPPKRMKIAFFAPHESLPSASDCMRNHEVEQCNKLQEDEVLTTCKEPAIACTSIDDNKLHERVTAQQPKIQSRQTTMKFENGRCILVPIEQNMEMDTGSQESSQVDTEDECYVMNQERKKKKKNKRKCSKEDDSVENMELPASKRKSSRKAAKEAAKQLSGLLHEPLPPGSSSLSKLTIEDDQVKLVPEIVVEDSETIEEVLTTLDNRNNDAIDVIAKEEIIVGTSSPVCVAKETADDSSDSDVICLTPRSQSPSPHDTAQRPPSQPSTPAKNKWSHIFGTKSPQKKSSQRSSPIRKSSPRKRSPRKPTPIKQVSMAPSSLASSREQYTLGVPLFYHVMQQSNSSLWSLPEVELLSINAHQLRSSHLQSVDLTTKAPCDQCNGHPSKKLINLDSDAQKKPLHLMFLNPNEKSDVLDRLKIKHASSLCNHFTLLNQQLSAERSRLLAEWASWEEQVRLVQAENERIEKEVVEVPEDPPLELIVSIRFLRTDIASELVTVDAGWYNKQQKNSQVMYNLRCRRQQQNWKEASDSDSGDPYERSSQLQKRKVKKRKKRLSCFASDNEDSSWSNEECEKIEMAVNSAPKKVKVLTKPIPGPPNFKPLNDQWVDLYAPRQPDHILGNNAAIQELCQWLTQWKEGRGGNYNKLQQRKPQGQSNCITLDDDSDPEEEEGASTVLLVRGPIGCGKTSAINACANKLGYKVFELNSSTRRSGSQVISILQEATQSHQITTQLKATKQATSSQEDDENESNETQDVKPSRTITSFFKPIGGGKTNKDGDRVGVAQSNSCKGAVEDDHFKLTLASHTVILIEEVDILFEDDKGFWSAIYDIIASSKRPIICTCNEHLVLQCRHDTIDMCRPTVREVSDHIQIVASSHDLYVPAGVACTLTAMLGCDTRRVIHALHYALCHASVTLKNVENSAHDVVPSSLPVSVIEQILVEAKCSLFSDIFLTNVVHQLETVSNCAKKLQSRLQRPWRNCGGMMKISQSKHGYDQLDTLSNACDWLSHWDIIGNGEDSSVLDPNNAHCWWDVTEQSCLLDTVQQLSGELEVEKIRKQRDKIAVCVEHLTEQNFSIPDNSSVIEELVLRAIETRRRREKFNSDMLAVVQNEFTNHYQLQHSAMATDFLPYMHTMCESEEGRKGRQRRFRHYLSARGVSDVTISSLLHHQKLLT